MTIDYHKEIKLPFLHNKLPAEVFDRRLKIIKIIEQHGTSIWTHAFFSETSCVPTDNLLSRITDADFRIEVEDRMLYRAGVCSVVLKAIAEIIDKNMATLTSKKSRLIYTDEYGDVVTGKWVAELRRFFKDKLSTPLFSQLDNDPEKPFEGLMSYSGLRFNGWISSKDGINQITGAIDCYIAWKAADHKTISTTKMTGMEYEIHIANIVNAGTNWTAELTKSSGDQGADLILTKGQIVIVIQTKYYSSKVGNQAVQEVFAAKKFYNADLAFVVSNADFTSSAFELAEKTGVKIITENVLINFLR
jgi:restriction system protein